MVNARLVVTPDFRLIPRAGSDPDASSVSMFGLRGTLGF